jgi:signal transduction histidine kinase
MMQQTVVPFPPDLLGPSEIQRETIHDLRNLFGIVSSAKHLLEEQPAEIRRLALLQAIEAAAIRGGELTTNLLARARAEGAAKRLNLNDQIMTLAPMLDALAHGIRFDLGEENPTVRVEPESLESVIFELVANAKAAGATTVTIRTRRKGARAVLKVVDNGCGMDPALLTRVRRCEDRRDKHGAGLCRVEKFARTAHAPLHIRSRVGRGTVVSMSLPTVLRMAASEPSAARPRAPMMIMKEKNRAKIRRKNAA